MKISLPIASYAVLSNHFHLTLYVDTEAARQWPDHEVITRWGQVFPGGLAGWYAKGDLVAHEERAVLEAQVPVWRERLADISGYMKCLSEFIARRANAEDHCKGRFWESRFRCQALLDSATSTESSTEHRTPILPTTLHPYLARVDWTGREIRKGKRGYIPDDPAPILSRLGVDEKEWIRTVKEFNKRFRFAAGALGKLEQWCHAVGRQWIQGRKTAAKLYVQPA